MTDKEKQEIKEVVNNYGVIRHKYWDKLNEIQRKQKEQEIHWHIGELQIRELSKELEKSNERKEFIEMTKKLDNDDEFEKYFRSACLKEFLNIHISPDNL